MLSVLIPTYDENVVALATALSEQIAQLPEGGELIIVDQASNGAFASANQSINSLPHSQYISWNEKRGRAANRNHLADIAKGDWLLFLDSDTEVISPNLLLSFWNEREEKGVVCGKMVYTDVQPPGDLRLRWKYGRAREMRSAHERNKHPFNSFLSFAFLIHRNSFNLVRFNEEIVEYGHEDTLFGKRLAHEFIRVKHTDIPLLHTGIIPADEFLEKVRQSIRSLEVLTENGHVDEDFRVYALQQRLAKMHLDTLAAGFFKICRKAMERNLTSRHPSLTLLDIYKLTYFCTLRRGVSTSAKTLRS